MANKGLPNKSDEKIEEFLEIMSNIGSELQKIIESINKISGSREEVAFKRVIKALSLKALYTHKAIELLLNHRFVFDSIVLLRSLLELVISAGYISKDPYKRTNLFIEYDIVARKRMHDRAIEIYGEKNLKINSEALKEKYNRVKDNYKQKSRWSDKSIIGMAKEAGLEDVYNLFYSQHSDFVHSNIRTIDNFLHIDFNRHTMSYPQEVNSKVYVEVIEQTSTFSYMLATILRDVFNLGELEELEIFYNKLRRRLKIYRG